jgi:hypothetical protein
MAEFVIDIRSYHRKEPDGSHTVTLEISGIPTLDQANRITGWMRKMILDGADQIGRLDPNTSMLS